MKRHNIRNIYSKVHIKKVNLENLKALDSKAYDYINPNHYLLESNIYRHANAIACHKNFALLLNYSSYQFFLHTHLYFLKKAMPIQTHELQYVSSIYNTNFATWTNYLSDHPKFSEYAKGYKKYLTLKHSKSILTIETEIISKSLRNLSWKEQKTM